MRMFPDFQTGKSIVSHFSIFHSLDIFPLYILNYMEVIIINTCSSLNERPKLRHLEHNVLGRSGVGNSLELIGEELPENWHGWSMKAWKIGGNLGTS